MAVIKTISYRGETREISFSGDAGSKFEMYVKESTNYYNWDTDSFQTKEKILKNQEIPSSGLYTKSIIIPTVTADTSYDFYVRPLPGSTLGVSTTNEQKIGVLYQKGEKKLTFTATESSALVVQNSGSAGSDLTGGTLNSISSTLTQTGTITEGSDPALFVYIHETPTWNETDGGSWTNANFISTLVIRSTGAVIEVKDGSNISSGYAVMGENIIDEITVSGISGNTVTLSASQNIREGQLLTFSKGGWKVDNITAEFTAGASGTATITMKTTHSVASIGIADVTSVLDVDAFASVKPNAFPVSVNCPAGGEVLIVVQNDCTNYLGQPGDNDENVADKTFTCHSIPSSSTSSLGTDGYYGTLDVAADAEMSGGEVTYTANANMPAGATDYFYYKCIDDQGTPVASATDQGKVSITIV